MNLERNTFSSISANYLFMRSEDPGIRTRYLHRVFLLISKFCWPSDFLGILSGLLLEILLTIMGKVKKMKHDFEATIKAIELGKNQISTGFSVHCKIECIGLP